MVYLHVVKGQLISKTNCQAEDSPKKRTNEFVFTSMRRVFVRFFGRILRQKKTFRDYLTFSLLWFVNFIEKKLPQASTEEELQIILNSLLRVVTIKLKKKSHFLLESQTIEEIIGKFKGYVGNLRPVQKLMLGKERHIKQ